MFKLLKYPVVLCVIVILFFLMVVDITGCGEESGNPNPRVENGSAIFSIKWPDEDTHRRTIQENQDQTQDQTINCEGISAIQAEVYDKTSDTYLTGDTFLCSAHKGTVDGIPVGENRMFVVSVLGPDEKILYQGESETFAIIKGEVANVGYIPVSRVDEPVIVPKAITNAIGMTLNHIPTGTFMMGSPENEPGRETEPDDEGQHLVTIKRAFYMQTTEVTQEQWERLMEHNPSGYLGCPRCPVEYVTWYDSVIFCNRLSIQENLTPCYYTDNSYLTVFNVSDGENLPVTSGVVYWMQDADGYRLPTEAEWEYAARAGTTTAFANGDITMPFGEDPVLNKIGWYLDHPDRTGQTQEVAQLMANNWGLYDMHGNVYEWCEDLLVIEAIEYRRTRGGYWGNSPRRCRSANRGYHHPGRFARYSEREISYGFRVVLNAEK